MKSIYFLAWLLLLTSCQKEPECAFNSLTRNGSSANAAQAARTEYYCPFFNPGGTPSGNYIFAFYEDSTAESELMSSPSYDTFSVSVNTESCTLSLNYNGVEKFRLTKPTLNSSNNLTGFHHYCVYCGGNDDAIGCTLRAATR